MVVPVLTPAVAAAASSTGVFAGIGGLATAFKLSTLGALQLAFTVGSVGYSIAMRPNPKDRRSEGGGFLLTSNPTDPKTPIPIALGRPNFVPPRVGRFVTSKSLNSAFPATGHKRWSIYVLGWGAPYGMDGGDLKVWADDTLLSNPQADAADQAELDSDTTAYKPLRVFRFRHKWVQIPTVTVYVNGIPFGVGGPNASGVITDQIATTYTDKQASVRKFTRPGQGGFPDDSIPEGVTRYGFFLPVEGWLEQGTLEVTALRSTVGFGTTSVVFGSGAVLDGAELKLLDDDVRPGNLSGAERKQYFWVDVERGAEHLTGFRVSYKATGFIKVLQDDEGTTSVVFPTDRAGSDKITASYRWGQPDEQGVSYIFRPGTFDQDPLPIDALRQSARIGEELEKDVRRAYDSENEVHDLEIRIDSGPAGFSDIAEKGSNAGDTRETKRRVMIELKERDAPDQTGSGVDLASGWIRLRSPRTGKDELVVKGNATGVNQWNYSAADWYRYTAANAPNAPASAVLAWNSLDGQNALDFKRYSVRVTALDTDGLDQFGQPAGQRVQNQLFLGAVTEVARYRLRLPGTSTLTVLEEDPSEFQGERVIRVEFNGAKVWIPDADATMDNLEPDGRPKGSPGWTRNPTHLAYHLIRLETIAAGKFYGWPEVTEGGALASWLAGAAWHDELVGGETRAEFDGVLTARRALHDHVAQIHAGARSYPMQSGGIWKTVIDKRTAPVYAITDALMLRDSLRTTWSAREERPDQLTVSHNDERLDQDLSPVVIRNGDSEPVARIVRDLDAYGVRRVSQVERVFARELRALQRNRLTFALQGASWGLMALEAGDFVTIQSGDILGTTKLCRVVRFLLDGDTLLPTLECAEYDPVIDGDAPYVATSVPDAPIIAASDAAFDDPAPEKLDVVVNADGSLTVDVGALNAA